ncbi:hypothetical protein PYW08_006452 [Mythimna loreyi]|uniref:Uncharacterized protein n=1 Tax=Mythimna loreyi TaxID=667449 RepID=A0ACC2QMM5_9NEOP|nr:hypothetical protein PYW08_006452 [Mythimna loreyi]
MSSNVSLTGRLLGGTVLSLPRQTLWLPRRDFPFSIMRTNSRHPHPKQLKQAKKRSWRWSARNSNLLKVCNRLHGALVSIIPKTMSNASQSTDATFDVKPYKLHNLDKGPADKATLTSDDALNYFKELQMCRRLETTAANLYKGKVIRGFCHLYSGQEAIAVGVKAVLRPQDSVITSYRCHAWTYMINGTVLGVLAELAGRKSGCVRGKGGSMHMYGKKFYGGNGIVGSQTPIGTGLAFAHKYRGDGGISFTLYGEGAANQGQLFEAFNIAKLWLLPVIFICENNKYGLGTSAARASACTDYYTRGHYIPGIWVDGMDVLACREATRYAIDWVTSGKGPIVLEMETYRYYGHSMSDPGTTYRTRDEVQQVRKTRDPIALFKEKILSKKLVTPEKVKEIETSVRKYVEEVVKNAANDTEIGSEELSGDIYVECIDPNIRGVRPDKPLTHISVAKRD